MIKIARGGSVTRTESGAVQFASGDEADGLDAFASESDLAPRPVEPPRLELPVDPPPDRGRGTATTLKWIAVVVISAGSAAAGMWLYQSRPFQARPASLTLQTTPPGVQVALDGKTTGLTPVTVSLPAGDYRVVLSAPGVQPREIAVSLVAGGSVVQHVEMGTPQVAAPATTGALRVETDPARQSVLVDGVEQGFSPITVPSLSVGEHVVVVRGERGTMRRTITVQAGETVSLVVSPTSGAISAGWVTFVSPIPMQLREDGRLVGTTESERLMMSAGDHEIELVNETFGFRTMRSINVAAQRTTTVRIDVPNGTLSINAQPWAEVWVGGERIGETPIANLSRPIGSHEVILRHPQFGERRATVTVSMKQTARLGVDMRTP
jgi:hypothetical protein